MNHFLALRLADSPRDRLAALADRLRAWELPARWVHPEDYHLTLVFLGDLDADEAHLVPTLVADVAGSLRRPRLRFAGLGAKGGRREPRVVYVALADDESACAGMQRDLGECLEVEADRAFLPHVTLCRPARGAPCKRLPTDRDWPHLLEAHGLADWGDCPTTDLVLYRSEPDGAIRYRELARWPLVGI
jgi:2'-5' RNA ligase